MILWPPPRLNYQSVPFLFLSNVGFSALHMWGTPFPRIFKPPTATEVDFFSSRQLQHVTPPDTCSHQKHQTPSSFTVPFFVDAGRPPPWILHARTHSDLPQDVTPCTTHSWQVPPDQCALFRGKEREGIFSRTFFPSNLTHIPRFSEPSFFHIFFESVFLRVPFSFQGLLLACNLFTYFFPVFPPTTGLPAYPFFLFSFSLTFFLSQSRGYGIGAPCRAFFFPVVASFGISPNCLRDKSLPVLIFPVTFSW